MTKANTNYFDISISDNTHAFAKNFAKNLYSNPYLSRQYKLDQIFDHVFSLIDKQVSLGLKKFSSNLNISFGSKTIIKPIRQLYLYLNIARLASNSNTLADIGCGRCHFEPFIRSMNLSYTGYDISDSQDLTSKIQAQNFINTDITDNNFYPSSADIFLCTEVIEHIPEPVSLLLRIYQALPRNSTFILTMPFYCTAHQEPYYFYNGFHPNFVSYLEQKYNFFVADKTLIKIDEMNIFQGYCFKKP